MTRHGQARKGADWLGTAHQGEWHTSRSESGTPTQGKEIGPARTGEPGQPLNGKGNSSGYQEG